MSMNNLMLAAAAAVAFGLSSAAWAQSPAEQGHDHRSMPETPPGANSTPTDHSGMDHGSKASRPGNGASPPAAPPGDGGMSHDSMKMQGGSPPPDARDPHAYSEGFGFGPLPRMRMADEHSFWSVLADRFESVSTRDNSSNEYDLQAWYGRDYDRLVLKAEGEIDGGKVHEARTELLWGHAIATFWDAQLGVRYDSGEGPNRTWLALGVQGLAPYWFEIDTAVYLGENGRSAFRIEAEYELLITQRLILQPRAELNFYGKKDPELDRGSGLSDGVAGLRLRYEFSRQFAPYIGIERTAKFGGTADLARAADTDTRETRYVAGVRLWF